MNNAHIFEQMHNEIDEYPMSSIERLERTFCTNFSCCNILLPDLHALLDHYDVTTSGHSVHALHPAPKTPVPFAHSPSASPPSSPECQSPTSPSSSPERRYVKLWPVSSTTCANATEIAASVSFVYQPDAYALSEYPTYEYCFDAATAPEAQSLERTLADALLKPPKSDPPRIHGAKIGDKGRRGGSSSAPYEHRKSSVKRKGKVDLAGVPLSTTRRRNKKAYQCPTPGCTKSYLNPNGLKYHQEKGTCKIEVFPSPVLLTPAPLPVESITTPTAVESVIAPTPQASPDPAPEPNTTPTLPAQHQHIHHPQPRQSLNTLAQWSNPNNDKGMIVRNGFDTVYL
ncbi:hypothetical protein DXG01_001373 [Tephrocybe rancida]|nr:hypothetical protein DXG01_001373 [Tephrocybe rancida]